jgi:hypothetical protein
MNDQTSYPPGMECGTVTVPQAGRALGLTRHGSYEAAKRGEIHTVRFGRLLKVPKAWLDRVLNPEEKSNERSESNV